MESLFSVGDFENKGGVTQSLIPKCSSCGLFKHCQSPKMPSTGKGKKRVLLVGEGPGCIDGDSLVDVAFRDKSKWPSGIPIKELEGKSDFYVYSFSVKKQKLVVGKVCKVWKTGKKKVWRVTYEWSYPKDGKKKYLRDSLLVTSNHLFLLKKGIAHDPFKGIKEEVDYLSIDTGLKVGHSLQPFYRRWSLAYLEVGTSHNSLKREGRFLLSAKVGRKLLDDEECHHKDENKLNDEWENLKLLTTEDHARHHISKKNPMNDKRIRKKHLQIVQSKEYRKKISKSMKRFFEDPNNYKDRLRQIKSNRERIRETVKNKFKNDPYYYYEYLKGRYEWSQRTAGKMTMDRVKSLFKKRFPDFEYPPIREDNHKVVKIEYVGRRDVYDMEIEKYHNFAVNGIFVHNSEEDKRNKQFVGKTGQLLENVLERLNIDMRVDCWLDNAVRCRPHRGARNRPPSDREIGFCRPNLLATIKEKEPDVIITLGHPALTSMLSGIWREKIGPMTRWLGWQIPSQTYNCWICPTWHPSYVSRFEGKNDYGVVEKIWMRHLKRAFKLEGKPWEEVPDYNSQVQVIIDPEEAAYEVMRFVRDKPEKCAWDYETNMRKPEHPNSRIVSCSISDGVRTISFPWFGAAIQAMIEFFKSKIKKIAANFKFEQRWTKKILGIDVRNWHRCTMTMQHFLDNRTGICSVKFLALVLLGFPIYDNEIKPYLKSLERGGYAPNRIDELELHSLLHYGGLDSLLEFKIAEKQEKLYDRAR